MTTETEAFKEVVKDVILKDWKETFFKDVETVRQSLISQIDIIMKEMGDIKISEFRQVIYQTYDEIMQEMREQMLAELGK